MKIYAVTASPRKGSASPAGTRSRQGLPVTGAQVQLEALQRMANRSPAVAELARLQGLSNAGPGTSPIQRVKIRTQIPLGGGYLTYETNGETVEMLESWLAGVHPDDRKNLEMAITFARGMGLRDKPAVTMPTAKANPRDDGVRRRRGKDEPPPRTSDDVPPPAHTHFETVHGETAHGKKAWASTGLAFGAGYLNPMAAFDANALKNSGTDTVNSASRARREFGRGEYRNAAISAGQTVLSGGQAAVSTPVGHIAGHAVSHAIGSPIPLPVGDAYWYPANAGKEKLDDLRTPKDKTQ